jgi:RNA recognition motif-containing protein
MKLLIRNLARNTTEAEVQALFEKHGPVQSCTLVLDKKSGGSKGFAFVDMPKAGAAKAAMKALNGSQVEGSKIRVKKADASPATGSPAD